MNKVILNGNLVRDMEVRQTSNGTDVGEFTIANNVGYGDNQKTTFVKCTLFGTRVESLQHYLIKGAKVLVEGSLEINNYKDDNDNWKTYVNIVVGELEIIKFVDEEEVKEEPKKSTKNGRNNTRKK